MSYKVHFALFMRDVRYKSLHNRNGREKLKRKEIYTFTQYNSKWYRESVNSRVSIQVCEQQKNIIFKGL